MTTKETGRRAALEEEWKKRFLDQWADWMMGLARAGGQDGTGKEAT